MTHVDTHTHTHTHNGMLFSLKNKQTNQQTQNPALCSNVDDLEDIRLTEMNQSQKDEYCIISPILSKLLKLIETESRMVVATAWG